MDAVVILHALGDAHNETLVVLSVAAGGGGIVHSVSDSDRLSCDARHQGHLLPLIVLIVGVVARLLGDGGCVCCSVISRSRSAPSCPS
jgi:hypothetical protein